MRDDRRPFGYGPPVFRETGGFVSPQASRTRALVLRMFTGRARRIPVSERSSAVDLRRWAIYAAAFSLILTSSPLPFFDAPARAQSRQGTIPLPPRRPAHLSPAPNASQADQQPATAQPPAGERGTTSAQPPSPQRKPPPLRIEPQHPLSQPGPMSERRAAVRFCYEEWMKMKKDGRSAGKVWRDFSLECLTRRKQQQRRPRN